MRAVTASAYHTEMPSRTIVLLLLSLVVLACATDIAMMGTNPLVQATPSGYHRVACELVVNLDKEQLGRFAEQYLSRQGQGVEARGIEATQQVRHTCADTLINVTFAYEDTDPEYNETIFLHAVDDQPPVLAFIPTQPDQIPTVVQCAHQALRVADEDVPAYYLPRFLAAGATDSCQKRSIARYQFEKVFNGPLRNHGQVLLHWSGDDGCGNTRGVTQSISVQDTTVPQFTQAAVDTYRRLGVHARLCIFGAQQTQVCAAKLVRDLALELTYDECDARHPVFIKSHVVNLDYLKCRPRSSTCDLIDRSTGGAMLAKRGYESGDFVRVNVRVGDSSSNFMTEDLLVEFRFASTRSACETYKNVPVFDAKQLVVADQECHALQNIL